MDGEAVHVAFTYDGTGGASAANGATLYINGVAVAATAGGGGTYEFSEALSQPTTLGLSPKSGRTIDGDITSAALFNRELTAAEVLRLSINGNVPAVSDQYGNETDLATNGAFASDVSWTKGAGWTIAAGVATCASGSTDLEQAQFASAVVGAVYRVTFTVSGFSSGTIQPLVGAAAGSARSANGTYTEDLIWASGANLIFRSAAFVGNIDNVTLVKLGAVLSLNPDNIDSAQWRDSSSNGLSGTITGATPLMETRALHINAASPAADEKLLTVSTAGVEKASIDEDGDAVVQKLNIAAIPTASAGLASGDVWSNSGVLTIIA